MAWKLVDIGYHDRFFLVDTCPANPGVFLKYLAGKRSLVSLHGEFSIDQ
jgi:hypothetical protein